jgi:hypothetical protein
LTTACLRSSGKMPSDRDKLMRVVMGTIRASRQDLRSLVGTMSNVQEAFDEDKMARRTSSHEAGVNEFRGMGGFGGGG